MTTSRNSLREKECPGLSASKSLPICTQSLSPRGVGRVPPQAAGKVRVEEMKEKVKSLTCVYRLVLTIEEGKVRVERGKAVLGDFSLFDFDIIEKIAKAVTDNLKSQLNQMGLPLKEKRKGEV
jgi:hypothetical protein